MTGTNPAYHALVERASTRISTAYRPKTVRTHTSHFKLLLQFLQFIAIDIKEMSHVVLALRSLALNVPVIRKAKGIFDIPTLQAIADTCDRIPLGYVYKPLFLLTFFAFLRLSNLAPVSLNEFAPLIHLRRGDVIPQPGFKWSKSLQKQSQFATIQIPALGESPVCLIKHFKS